MMEELPEGAVNVAFENYKAFENCLQDQCIKGVIYSGSREHCDSIRGDYTNVLN